MNDFAFVREHPLLTLFGMLAVLIFLLIKSSWLHKIGYIIFLVLILPNDFEIVHNFIQPYIDKYAWLEFIYSDAFFVDYTNIWNYRNTGSHH